MFIGCYELDNKMYCGVYYNCKEGWQQWFEETFSPNTKNISMLGLNINGKNYKEKKNYLVELAKEYQLYFASLPWSYGELAEIETWFYNNAKRYGLLGEFRENGIC